MNQARQGGRRPSTVAVEWVYVRYRTVLAVLVIVALAAGGGAWWWLGGRGGADRDAADRAIARAEELLARARERHPGSEPLDRAGEHLAAAREARAAGDWPGAVDEAEAAALLARDVLDQEGGGETGVRLVRVEGDVRIKRAGQFLWEGATERMVLHEGDQVRTGGDGTARLLYFDGAMMTVSPGTLLEIRELFRDGRARRQRVAERLAWGRLRAATRAAPGVDSVHEVATEDVRVRAAGTAEFEVGHDREAGRSEVVSLAGEVRLDTADREVPLPENTRVSLARGRIVEQERLLAPPDQVSPPDQKAFLAPREAQVTLSWGPVSGASFYHLVLATRPFFAQATLDLDHLARTSVELPPLAPGTYYWRVAAVDGKGNEGRWSPVRRFRVLGSEFRDPDDRTPPALEVREILVVGANAIIHGRTEPGALLWIDGERVDLEDDGSFTWVIRLRRDGENRISFLAQDAAGNETRRTGYAYVDAY